MLQSDVNYTPCVKKNQDVMHKKGLRNGEIRPAQNGN